jgi:ornithine decarboxylase
LTSPSSASASTSEADASTRPFVDAVHLARKAFDEGAKLGFEFSLLDIGGGFPPSTSSTTSSKITFTDIATSLAPAIDALFPPTVRVIAEPGRYYVGAAFALAVQIVARRVVPSADEQAGGVMYYVNDGVYGSFNCIMFDHAEPQPLVLVQSNQFVYNNNQPQQQRVLESSIWGPTCDSIDCVGKGFRLPEMQVGDWLVFENMGAYTMCAASQFNGFRKSAVVYTNTEVGGVEE